MDLCTIIDLETQVIDPDTGDVSDVVICENQICDFQPKSTFNYKGVLMENSPYVYLPPEFEKVDDLSRDMGITISRFRSSQCSADTITEEDRKTNPNKKHFVRAKIEDWQEINVEGKLLGIEIELSNVIYM